MEIKSFHFKPLLSFEESADNDLRMTEVSRYSYYHLIHCMAFNEKNMLEKALKKKKGKENGELHM